MKRGGGVLSGGSWGRLRSSEKRKRYVDLLCPLVTSSHPKPSCDALWGDEVVNYWRGKGQRAKCISPNGHEVMKCHRSAGELSTQCTLKDAIVDFSLMPININNKNDGKKLSKTVFPHGTMSMFYLSLLDIVVAARLSPSSQRWSLLQCSSPILHLIIYHSIHLSPSF